ncbi:hypothetical protein IMZ48_01540 [Candidatus Bathyarchaeota archaeon]|nr:hypothetical protein [Candidatus Bathyarchaeota archaeon]
MAGNSEIVRLLLASQDTDANAIAVLSLFPLYN